MGDMQFEFDPNKSESNRIKHGIDFMQAQRLWEDPDRLVVPAKTQGEPRYLMVAKMDGRHWSAIFTPRGDKTKIISVRRSRSEEEEAYED